MKTAVISFVAAVAGGLFVLILQPQPASLSASVEQQPPGNVPAVPEQLPPNRTAEFSVPRVFNAQGLAPNEAVAAYTYQANNRCVANIATQISSNRMLFRTSTTSDAGSGFVIDNQGHLLTNYHVIEGAQRIRVTLFNGESFEAERVGIDPINDMAVIRIDAPQELLYPVKFGSSSDLQVGMTVFAIGNPFGLERTMTTGIISSLNRTLPVTRARSIKSVIQIDAAINPGNSGGPLLNSHGELIGMNTAIASSTGQNSGIGFAIPVNLIARVVPELIEHGKVIRPDHGIVEVLRTERGLRILLLDPDGPAAAAGFRGPERKRIQRGLLIFETEDPTKADIIVGVNGKKTLRADEFLFEVESHHPGDVIEIDVIREGRVVSIPLRLR